VHHAQLHGLAALDAGFDLDVSKERLNGLQPEREANEDHGLEQLCLETGVPWAGM
jgi:hypothetical protein